MTENTFDINDTLLPTIRDLDDMSYLENINNYDMIPEFIPQIKYAKVTNIYDEYVIEVAAKLQFNDSIYKFLVRLKEIESCTSFRCQVRSHNDRKAQKQLMPLICNKIVELKNIENYRGKLYVDIYYNTMHINQWLVDNKLAIPYERRWQLEDK
jgi:hypothetical protein